MSNDPFTPGALDAAWLLQAINKPTPDHALTICAPSPVTDNERAVLGALFGDPQASTDETPEDAA